MGAVRVAARSMVDIITAWDAKSWQLSHSTAINAVFTAVGTEWAINTVCAITPSNVKIWIKISASTGPIISLENTERDTSVLLNSNVVLESCTPNVSKDIGTIPPFK